MATNGFIPRPENERVNWFSNMAAKLPNHASKYNITDAQVLDVANGAAFTAQWYNYKLGIETHKQQVNKYNDEQLNGVAAGAVASVSPTPPALPTLTAPAPGALMRAVAIGKIIKAQTIYTEADGKDMGLIGTEIVVEAESMKPTLTIRLVGGGHPEIVWHKHGMDGIERYKDNGDGTFALLVYDTYPNHIDTTPLPATGQTAVWKYKAIYRFHDAHVGQWSDAVNVTVIGGL